MHEHSLIEALLNKILSLASDAGASKIVKVSVRLGALSQMSPTHLKEHFGEASRGTIAENAEIDAEESSDVHDPHAPFVFLKGIDIR
jgi:hydrogenase nickel incorporation protein HypA/HybF